MAIAASALMLAEFEEHQEAAEAAQKQAQALREVASANLKAEQAIMKAIRARAKAKAKALSSSSSARSRGRSPR